MISLLKQARRREGGGGGDEWPAKEKNLIYVYRTKERRKDFFLFLEIIFVMKKTKLKWKR